MLIFLGNLFKVSDCTDLTNICPGDSPISALFLLSILLKIYPFFKYIYSINL